MNNNEYIFVACAMKREANLIINKLDNYNTIKENGFEFFFGTIYNKKIIVGISEPGIINMSSMISIALIKYNICVIINYGMVGGYGTNIHKNDIIIGKECMNINSYITGKLEKGIDINLWEFVTFKDGEKDELTIYNANNTLLNNCKGINHNKSNIIIGRIGSGDIWDREFDKINLLHSKYKICCEDMESVAIYQLSNRFNIPCISIKGVSNNEILKECYDDSVLKNLLDYILEYIKIIEI